MRDRVPVVSCQPLSGAGDKLCDAAALLGEGERGGMVGADDLAVGWFQKSDVEWLLRGGGQPGQYH